MLPPLEAALLQGSKDDYDDDHHGIDHFMCSWRYQQGGVDEHRLMGMRCWVLLR